MSYQDADYLKYWRVIKQFVKRKYKLDEPRVEVLLFLKSEQYFDLDKLREFEKIIGWKRLIIHNLMRDDWIRVFRPHVAFKQKRIYQLSPKAKALLKNIYLWLDGTDIPTDPRNNRMFMKNVKGTDKVYRDFIINMQALKLAHKRKEITSLDGFYD